MYRRQRLLCFDVSQHRLARVLPICNEVGSLTNKAGQRLEEEHNTSDWWRSLSNLPRVLTPSNESRFQSLRVSQLLVPGSADRICIRVHQADWLESSKVESFQEVSAEDMPDFHRYFRNVAGLILNRLQEVTPKLIKALWRRAVNQLYEYFVYKPLWLERDGIIGDKLAPKSRGPSYKDKIWLFLSF